MRSATITITAATKATNTVGTSPPPAETPKARKIQPPTDAPDQTENQIPGQPVSASALPLGVRSTQLQIYHKINYMQNINYIIIGRQASAVSPKTCWTGLGHGGERDDGAQTPGEPIVLRGSHRGGAEAR